MYTCVYVNMYMCTCTSVYMYLCKHECISQVCVSMCVFHTRRTKCVHCTLLAYTRVCIQTICEHVCIINTHTHTHNTAMKFLEEVKLVHADLKTENVLLQSSGRRSLALNYAYNFIQSLKLKPKLPNSQPKPLT